MKNEPDPRDDTSLRDCRAVFGRMGRELKGLIIETGLLWALRLTPKGSRLEQRLAQWIYDYLARQVAQGSLPRAIL